MSAITNGRSASPTSPSTISPSKSKKRKHEGDLQRSSSKKRKHEKKSEDVAASPLVERSPDVAAVEEGLSKKKTKEKKEKKQKKRSKDVVEEEEHVEDDSATNGNAHAESETQVVEPVAEGVERTSRSEKKKKKKKDKRKASPIPESEPGVDNTTNDDADPVEEEEAATSPISDHPMLDAPAPDDNDNTELPTSSTTTTLPLIAPLLTSTNPSPFHSKRLSLLLPLPAIALSPTHALSSLIAQHLAPLLLTYFPPAYGVVLAFSDPVLSANAGVELGRAIRPPPPSSDSAAALGQDDGGALGQGQGQTASQLKEVLATTGPTDEFGALWVWLTATFLVFAPEKGEELVGWTNVVSEGFVGVVCYNYFQVGVGRERVRGGGVWSGVEAQENGRRRGRKGRLGQGVGVQSSPAVDEEVEIQGSMTGVYGQRLGGHDDENEDGSGGYFIDTATNQKVENVLKFRVVDTEMVPSGGHGDGGMKMALQIDATLLDEEAERRVREEERGRWERQIVGRRGKDGRREAEMSGALG